jgi:hypothetical protein
MGRISTKEFKTVYQSARDELDLSREKASELTGLEPYRIERIENEKMEETPWDVVAMANAYEKPELCNYYCSNKCPIGQKYTPEIEIKDLSQVVLELLANLNSARKSQEMLIDITADGTIEQDELEDFVHIQKELEKISITVETLQLWVEKMMAKGKIDVCKYNELMKK